MSFGEDASDDQHELYVQLAREVLADIEAEKAPQDALSRAQDLQVLFITLLLGATVSAASRRS